MTRSSILSNPSVAVPWGGRNCCTLDFGATVPLNLLTLNAPGRGGTLNPAQPVGLALSPRARAVFDLQTPYRKQSVVCG
jgi:hypothetical protein